MENAKKKKGLWFTLLSTFSLAGIFISLYFVNFLVSDVAQKTYENQKNHYLLTFKNKLITQKEYTEAIAITLSKNKDMADGFFQEDPEVLKEVLSKLNQTIDKINSAQQADRLKASFVRHENLSGIVIGKNGAVIESVVGMLDKNGTIISVSVKENMEYLVTEYKKEHKEFAFLLNESSIHKIDKEVRKKLYTSYHDKLYVKYDKFNKAFLEQLKTLQLEDKVEENGYFKDNRYFYVYQKVYNYDGEYVGLGVVAEEVKDDNSFVNLVKNLVNSVTMVALGLIVSMLLFLF